MALDKTTIDNFVKISIDNHLKNIDSDKKQNITVKIRKFDDSKIVYFNPIYATPGSSGMDICSIDDTILKSGEYKAISTNISVQLPDGYELQIRPRSGLALNHGITVLNSPGTVDSDYIGHIKVILINHSKKDFEIKSGDRIAQMVLCKVYKCSLFECSNFEQTVRGTGGFNSTGRNFNEYMELASLNYLSSALSSDIKIEKK